MKAISELSHSVSNPTGNEEFVVNKLIDGQYKSFKVKASIVKEYVNNHPTS